MTKKEQERLFKVVENELQRPLSPTSRGLLIFHAETFLMARQIQRPKIKAEILNFQRQLHLLLNAGSLVSQPLRNTLNFTYRLDHGLDQRDYLFDRFEQSAQELNDRVQEFVKRMSRKKGGPYEDRPLFDFVDVLAQIWREAKRKKPGIRVLQRLVRNCLDCLEVVYQSENSIEYVVRKCLSSLRWVR